MECCGHDGTQSTLARWRERFHRPKTSHPRIDGWGCWEPSAISRAEWQTFAKDVLAVDLATVAGDMVKFATLFLAGQSAAEIDSSFGDGFSEAASSTTS